MIMKVEIGVQTDGNFVFYYLKHCYIWLYLYKS